MVKNIYLWYNNHHGGTMQNKKKLMLEGSILKAVIIISLPIMLSNLMQTLYNLTDTFWLGRYEIMYDFSGELIAAMVLIFPALSVLMALAVGISTACISLISQSIGANNEEYSKKIAAQAISFSFILSIIIGIIGYFSADGIMYLLGAKGNVYTYGSQYLKIMMLGMPTIFLFFSYNSIKQAQGDSFSPMIFSAISVILNIILDPIFMIVLKMGIEGAAYATVISRGLFIIFAVLSLFKESTKHFKLEIKDLKLDFELINDIIKVALPSSISSIMSSLGFSILGRMVISFGVATMTAFGIGNRIIGLILMPAMGIGSALASIVGANLGANNVDRAKKTVRTSFLISSSVLIIGGIFIYIFSEEIIRLFTNVPDIISQSVFYLKLTAATIPLMAAFSILNGVFIGSGHTKYSLFISAGRLWMLRIPMILISLYFTDLGSHSVYYAMALSNLIICIMGYMIYRTGKWEKKII